MTFVLSAYAQQPASTPASPDDTNQQLLARINALEAKVKQLEEKEAAPGPPLVPAPPPAPEVEMPEVHEVAPRLQLNVFGDVGYQYTQHIPNTFDFGSLDLFMRSRLSDKFSTLGECCSLRKATTV